MRIIDVHNHIQMEDFDADREAVLQRARDAGVGMIAVGVDGATSAQAHRLASIHGDVWATVGYHPHDADDFDATRDDIKKIAHEERVVGIGECGLDYFKMDETAMRTDAIRQKELFQWHVKLSHDVRKPLVIHCREAFADMFLVLENNRQYLLEEPGICHFFTGTMDDARRLLELNFSFTFGGLITFNQSFDDVIRYIPASHILAETDAPFVSPLSHRGKRNEPAYILETVSALAGIKEMNGDALMQVMFENAKRVFQL